MDQWEEYLPSTSQSMPSLTVLDDRCRCSVCKDYLHGPMMTLCGHTFCSLCIRRALNADGRCPTCRSLEEESKLRKNLMIEEIVEAYLPFRMSLMEYAPAKNTSSSEPLDHKESISMDEVDDSDQNQASSSPLVTPHPIRSTRITRATSSQASSVSVTKDRDLKLPAGHIACPVCQAPVHQDKADHHVNRCLEGRSSPPTLPNRQSTSSPGTQSRYFSEKPLDLPTTSKPKQSTRQQQAISLKRLPKMSYAAMSDAKLRKAMSDMGISSAGNRAQLQRRCTEFIAMWNANLDSKTPKSKRELVSEMKAWDRVQAKPVIKATSEEIESAHQNGKFDDNFSDLIAQARESMRKRKASEIIKTSTTTNENGAETDVLEGDVEHEHKRRC